MSPNKKQKVKRNFDENGHFMVQERIGKDRTDAYYSGGEHFDKIGKDPHIITSAHVKIDIVPTLGGKIKSFASKGFPTRLNSNTGTTAPMTTPLFASYKKKSQETSPKKSRLNLLPQH